MPALEGVARTSLIMTTIQYMLIAVYFITFGIAVLLLNLEFYARVFTVWSLGLDDCMLHRFPL